MLNKNSDPKSMNDAILNFKIEVQNKSEPKNIDKEVLWELFKKYAGEDYVFNKENENVVYTILKYFSNDDNFNSDKVIKNEASLDKGLLLFGPNGVGKSYLFEILHKIGIHLSKFGFMQLWFQKISAKPFVINYMQEVKNPNSNFYLENYYGGKLYIGDLGLEEKAFGKKELIGDILFERNRVKKKTFITTNLDPIKIWERYGDAIGDRLPEMFNIIKLEGDSYRHIK